MTIPSNPIDKYSADTNHTLHHAYQSEEHFYRLFWNHWRRVFVFVLNKNFDWREREGHWMSGRGKESVMRNGIHLRWSLLCDNVCLDTFQARCFTSSQNVLSSTSMVNWWYGWFSLLNWTATLFRVILIGSQIWILFYLHVLPGLATSRPHGRYYKDSCSMIALCRHARCTILTLIHQVHGHAKGVSMATLSQATPQGHWFTTTLASNNITQQWK